MRVPLFIAQRLSLRGSDAKSSITGVVIAVTGVALAVMIMEFSLAIVGGFRQGIVDKLTGFDADVVIDPAYDPETDLSDSHLRLDNSILRIIEEIEPDADVMVTMRQPAVLKTESDFAGIMFQAYSNDYDNKFLKQNIVSGVCPDFKNPENNSKIVVSKDIATQLGLSDGNHIMAYFFIDGNIKARKLDIVAIYSSNFSEYDKTICYASLPLLQQLNDVDSITATRLELRGGNITTENAPKIAEILQTKFINDYQNGNIDKLYPVDNVQNMGRVYFNWFKLLDTNVIVIFILMILVSGFTLISSLFILILEHIPTIGLLRAMGGTKSFVNRIFISMAMRIVGFGLIIGNIVGLGALLLQQKYKLLSLNAEMYYLDSVPVEINWWQIIALNVGVLALSWVILVLPARFASTISPAKTIRYE